MTGDVFHRSVVLLLSHSAEEGTWGVVVNRPGTTAVDRLLPGWGAAAAAPEVVHRGGPVGLDGALALGVPAPGPEAARRRAGAFRPLGPGLGVVDLAADPEEVAGGLDGLRVFVGHAGWSPGQLEDEVAAGAWWVVPGTPRDAVASEPASLWTQVLRRQVGPLRLHVTMPDDPTLN